MVAKVGRKLGIVYVVVEKNWHEQKIRGVFSTVDSALDSCYNLFESEYPNSVWVWDGKNKTLENDNDEFHMIFLMQYQVDNDNWRR